MLKLSEIEFIDVLYVYVFISLLVKFFEYSHSCFVLQYYNNHIISVIGVFVEEINSRVLDCKYICI